MISNRKAKKLLARGQRIQKVAVRHYILGPHRYQQKYGHVNKTSDLLSDFYYCQEAEALDNHLLDCAIG